MQRLPMIFCDGLGMLGTATDRLSLISVSSGRKTVFVSAYASRLVFLPFNIPVRRLWTNISG